MVQTISATEIDLYSLKENFGLERTKQDDFFGELNVQNAAKVTINQY